MKLMVDFKMFSFSISAIFIAQCCCAIRRGSEMYKIHEGAHFLQYYAEIYIFSHPQFFYSFTHNAAQYGSCGIAQILLCDISCANTAVGVIPGLRSFCSMAQIIFYGSSCAIATM